MSVYRGLKLRTPRRAQGVNYYTLAPPDPPPDSCDRTSTRITSHFCDKLWVALGLQLQWEYWKRFKRLKGKLPERRKTKVTLVHVVYLFLAPPPPPYLMYLSIFIRPLSVLSSCPFHFLSHQSFFSPTHSTPPSPRHARPLPPLPPLPPFVFLILNSFSYGIPLRTLKGQACQV